MPVINCCLMPERQYDILFSVIVLLGNRASFKFYLCLNIVIFKMEIITNNSTFLGT